MSNIRDFQTPEMATWIRSIVSPMIQEQMEIMRQEIREDGLERLERSLTTSQKRTEERFGHLEVALAELAEAQKHTEEQVAQSE